MAQKDYTKHQQGIINRYYDNLDTIMLQKLQELVTELYLATNTAKEDKLWERVGKAMEKLKIPAGIQENIMVKRNVEVLAKNMQEWLKGASRK